MLPGFFTGAGSATRATSTCLEGDVRRDVGGGERVAREVYDGDLLAVGLVSLCREGQTKVNLVLR